MTGGSRMPGMSVDARVLSADFDPDDDRCLIRMAVPTPVRAAFDEALEIHRAVSGQQTSIVSFVEALVGEAFAGPRPPDTDVTPIQTGPDQAALEEHLAERTENWRFLQDSGRIAEGGRGLAIINDQYAHSLPDPASE